MTELGAEELVLQNLLEEVCLDELVSVFRAYKRDLLRAEFHDYPRERGMDVFGNRPVKLSKEEPPFICQNCGRTVHFSKFAPHLEKCMGKTRAGNRKATGKTSRKTSGTNKSEQQYAQDWEIEYLVEAHELERNGNLELNLWKDDTPSNANVTEDDEEYSSNNISSKTTAKKPKGSRKKKLQAVPKTKEPVVQKESVQDSSSSLTKTKNGIAVIHNKSLIVKIPVLRKRAGDLSTASADLPKVETENVRQTRANSRMKAAVKNATHVAQDPEKSPKRMRTRSFNANSKKNG